MAPLVALTSAAKLDPDEFSPPSRAEEAKRTVSATRACLKLSPCF
jgi:hypothetical protein